MITNPSKPIAGILKFVWPSLLKYLAATYPRKNSHIRVGIENEASENLWLLSKCKG